MLLAHRIARHTHTFRTAVTAAVLFAAIAPAVASARFDLNPTHAAPPGGAPVVQVVHEGRGFDWGDAGIGAAAGVGLSLLAVGGSVTTASRRRRRTVSPTVARMS
jgi:hypothetical protein